MERILQKTIKNGERRKKTVFQPPRPGPQKRYESEIPFGEKDFIALPVYYFGGKVR